MKALPLALPLTDADGVAEMDKGKGSPVDRPARRDMKDGSMGILTPWSWLCNRSASGSACSQKSHDHKRVYRTSGAVQRIARALGTPEEAIARGRQQCNGLHGNEALPSAAGAPGPGRGRQADTTPYHPLRIISMRGNRGLLLMTRTVRWVEKTVHVGRHARGQLVWPWPHAPRPAARKRANAELSRASKTGPFVTCHFKRQNTQETPAVNRHKPPGRRGNRVVWTEIPVVWAEKPGKRTK